MCDKTGIRGGTQGRLAGHACPVGQSSEPGQGLFSHLAGATVTVLTLGFASSQVQSSALP